MDQLSVELVELIYKQLDDPTSLAFRAVSRRLYRATFDSFTQRWFATLRTDFTLDSLSRLSCISQDRDLASRVRCLRIDRHEGRLTPVWLTWPLSNGEAKIFDQPCARRESGPLDLDSPQAKTMREMLLRFAHCNEICVTDGFRSRFWDQPPPGELSPIDICWLMLSLLGGDGGLQIERFELDFERNPIEKTDSWPSGPELCTCLSQSSWATHLRQLSISLEFKESLLEVMIPLVTTAAQLKSLTLCHWGYSEVDAFFSRISCAPQVPALSELRLAGCNQASPAVLPRFIARFQTTLESLYIRSVSVAGGTIGGVLGHLANLDWPALTCITVPGCYREFFCRFLFNKQAMDQCGDGFEFTLRNFREKTRVDGVRYRGYGDDIKVALSAFGGSYKMPGKDPGPEIPAIDSSVGFRVGRVVKRQLA
ncbi:hypothetical protein PG993_007966 [Apiospora rasikravindrae]|uniref:F-box domain-containing protein n=1 Tax=Apiospora rasikravindrae TaxID=990691 RepID=A0ABR1SZ00_9PEZI